jgi:APA family basic amino acid/polyamine antiporter
VELFLFESSKRIISIESGFSNRFSFCRFVVGQGSFSHFGEGQPFHFDFSGWKSAGLSLMFIMFAYSGWNSATYIGSEIKNPKRNIPRSLLISTAIVMILYLLLNLYFVYAISPAEMVGEPEIGALAAGKSFGNTAGTVISLLISFALFSSLSAFVILGPRVYYSMAREGYFFGFAARLMPGQGAGLCHHFTKRYCNCPCNVGDI